MQNYFLILCSLDEQQLKWDVLIVCLLQRAIFVVLIGRVDVFWLGCQQTAESDSKAHRFLEGLHVSVKTKLKHLHKLRQELVPSSH